MLIGHAKSHMWTQTKPGQLRKFIKQKDQSKYDEVNGREEFARLVSGVEHRKVANTLL